MVELRYRSGSGQRNIFFRDVKLTFINIFDHSFETELKHLPNADRKRRLNVPRRRRKDVRNVYVTKNWRQAKKSKQAVMVARQRLVIRTKRINELSTKTSC